MRNLKRALSLTLASVMLLGMMVVGSSAAAGYDDVAETDNVEAIEVLQAIEVMVGDERGFGPERPVNRAEMAVVMGKLLNLDYNYYSATCPFDDVYDWARGWVGACAASKIVSGRGDGVYDPGATVTAVEAASMLMRALGYFQYQNDYADGFEVSTVRMGKTIGIFDDVGSSATEPMTRNQVAQMVLNALQCGMVEPDGNTINLTTPDGTVLTGKVNYVKVTSNKAFAKAISKIEATSVGSNNDSPIVELGEQLYNGKLTLDDEALDAFKRPARHWEYDGKDIGTYMKKELLRKEYTAKVTGKDLYEELTKATIDKYDFIIAIDGETEKDVLDGYGYFTKNNLIRSNTEGVGRTGNGVLTQVFVDPDSEMVYIAVINTYLAKANADYNEKKDEATYTTWKLVNHKLGTNAEKVLVKANDSNKAPGTVNLTVSGEDFDIADVKDGDIVLVQVADGEIQEMFDPEIINEVTLNSFKRGDWVRADGTQYDYASAIRYDTDVLDEYDDVNMKETEYRIYLDKYGYAIGIEIIEEPDQYVFLTGIDLGTSNLNNKTAEGNVIHMDGTMDTVKINMDKSLNAKGFKFREGNDGLENKLNTDGSFKPAAEDKGTGVSALMNTWCRYAVDKNGVYTLTEVANSKDTWTDKSKAGQGTDLDIDSTTPNLELVKLDKSHIYLNGIQDSTIKRVYTNDDTVFLAVDTDEIVYKNLPGGIEDGKTAVIISDVESVGTGHQNVNLDAWNAAQVKADGKYTTALKWTSNGVYNLFDDDGFVIAAVVVGEDAGTSTTYAYILNDDLIQEDYDSEKDEWTWYREAVVNGEVVKLTEKGETNPELGDLGNGKGGQARRGEWHEVKYKADGTVRSVKNLSSNAANILPGNIPAYDFDGYEPYPYPVTPDWDSRNGKYVCDVKYVEAATDQFNTILLWDDLTDATRAISAEGHSLWVKTNADTKDGFSINPSAKTVLIQDVYRSKDGLKIMGETSEYTGGITGVKQALKEINEDNDTDYIENEVGNFRGFVGAVFENGMATSIVIYDKTASFLNQGNDPTSRNYTLTLMGNLVDYEQFTDTQVSYTLNGVETKNISGTAKQMTVDGVTRLARDYIIPAGATVVIYDKETNTVTPNVYTVNMTGTNASGSVTIPVTVEKGSGTKSGTVSFVMNGNLIIDDVPTKDTTGDYVTLTLGTGYTGAEVRVNNVTVEPTRIESSGAGDKAVYEKIAKNASVVIILPNTASVDSMTYKVNGVSVEQFAATKRVEIKDMSANVELDAPELIINQTYTVKFMDGITPSKWYGLDINNGWAAVSRGCVVELPASAVTDNGDGTYTIINKYATIGVAVTPGTATNVIASATTAPVEVIEASSARVMQAGPVSLPKFGSETGGTYTPGTPYSVNNFIDFDGEITEDWVVYKSTKVTFDASAKNANIKFWGVPTNVAPTWYLRSGVTTDNFALSSTAPVTGLIASADGKIVGANVAEAGMLVGDDDITVYGAFKVEADATTKVFAKSGASVSASDTAVASGQYVKTGSHINAFKASNTATAADVIDVSEGATWATAKFIESTVGADIKLQTAVEVDLGTSPATLSVTSDNEVTGVADATVAVGDGSDVKVYFVEGTEFTVRGTPGRTVSVTEAAGGTNKATIKTDGNTAKVTVGDSKLTISES